MSERQAKLKRKNDVVETPAKKKSTMDVVFNIIIIVLILAVLGVGGWAVYSKFSQMPKEQDPEATGQMVPTLAEYTTSMGITVEDFLAEYGLEGVEAITGESDMNEVTGYMTVGNYAKMFGQEPKAILDAFGVQKEYSDDTPMGVIMNDLIAANQTESSAKTQE